MMRRFNSSFSKPSLLTWLCLLSLGLATGSPLIGQDKDKDKKERKKEDKERRKRQLQEEQEDYYKKWQKEDVVYILNRFRAQNNPLLSTIAPKPRHIRLSAIPRKIDRTAVREEERR